MKFRQLFSLAMSATLAMGISTSSDAETVAYFTFDGITGTSFSDVTGNGFIGTLGVPDTAGAPDIVPGPSGADGDNAVALSGDGGLVVDDSATFSMDIFFPFTVEGWFKSSGTVLENNALINYGRNSGGYQIQINPDGIIEYHQPGVQTVVTGVPFPFDDEWHHIAVVTDIVDFNATIYLDGELIHSEPVADNNIAGFFELVIGRDAYAPNSTTFQGSVDRVRITAAALSIDEIDSDAANPKPVTDDTIAYFDFDGGELPFQNGGSESGLTMGTVRGFTAGNLNAPELSNDTPSGLEGDQSIMVADGSHALVLDPNKALEVGGEGNDMTLEAWIKYDESVTNGRMVIFYYGPGSYSFSISGGDPRLLFVTALRIVDFSSQGAVVPPNQWNHVALVHVDGESFTFYVNGEIMEVNPYTQGIRLAEVNQLTIGAEPNGVLPFNGLIDRVRISNVALSADEFDLDPLVLADVPVSVQEWALY